MDSFYWLNSKTCCVNICCIIGGIGFTSNRMKNMYGPEIIYTTHDIIVLVHFVRYISTSIVQLKIKNGCKDIRF